MRPHVPDEKHNNHIAAKYMALHVPETYLHVKALRLLCCTLYDNTATRYLYLSRSSVESLAGKKGINQVFGHVTLPRIENARRHSKSYGLSRGRCRSRRRLI